jgi:hypothetical protein
MLISYVATYKGKRNQRNRFEIKLSYKFNEYYLAAMAEKPNAPGPM